MTHSATRRWLAAGLAGAVGSAAAGCVYYNALYNAERDFARAERALRDGRSRDADLALDSVIVKTGRVLVEHPDSKYADDAALLKARSEVHRRRWESARASAAVAARLASDPGVRALAEGLMGVAAFRLGDPAAEVHLDRALERDLSPRDRTTFLFVRGRARLARGAAEEAAADLRAAVEQAEGSGLDRLELAFALAGVGDFEQAAVLARGLLAVPSLVELNEAQRTLVDTLVEQAPALLAGALDELLPTSTRAVRTSLLHLHRARARERLGDRRGASEDYRAAHDISSSTRSAGEAGYRGARLQLREAREAEAVAATLGGLQTAVRVAPAVLRDSAQALLDAVRRFGGLVGAYESRGTSAAEALLRAAEVARHDLTAPALARGLYLRYLQAAPGSRWAAKATLGALALTGHSGDGVLGAADRGAETDEELRRRLDALGPADPYLLAQARASSAVAESAYARSERELRRRLADISGLFEAPAAPVDTAEAAPDSAAEAVDTTRAGGGDTTRAER